MIWPMPVIEPLVTITPLSLEAGVGGPQIFNGANQGLNTHGVSAWPNANQAIFIPFMLSKQITFATMFIGNSNVASGNIDVGVYASDGTKIVSSGSTAMSGTQVLQLFTVSSTTIGPGVFYLAMAVDNVSATFDSFNIGQVLKTKFTGMAQMATAFPLPSSATLATLGSDFIPMVGLSTRSTI